MTQENTITLEYPKPRDAWDTLSMREKAEMIGVAVRNGITNLNDIRDRYNEFAEGGSKEEAVNTDEQYLTTMERVAEDNYQKWGFSNPDEALLHVLNDNTYDYRGYYGKYPQSRANADTHWTDEFKTVYHPTFSNESIYSGQKSQYNPLGLPGGFWSGDTFVPMAWQLDANEYKKGGGIHIAPSKKGTFTAAAKKHGKSVQAFASQVLAHPENYSPAMRKKANFARNSRRWKHGLGGNLFLTGGPTQDNDPATKDWEHRREHEEVHPMYQRTQKDGEYWREKQARNAKAAEELNRKKRVVMSALEEQADSTPFTGEGYRQAAEDQRQRVLDKAKEFEKMGRATVTAAELGISGASLLGAWANYRNWANSANMTRKTIANLLQKAQQPLQEAGTLIDGYQTMDGLGNNAFDTYYNGASGVLGVAGTVGASDVFRGRYPWIDRILDTSGIIQNAGDFVKFGYDTFSGSNNNEKALGGNLFDGTTQPTQKMQIGLDVQGWPDYTTEQIVAYGDENERRRKAIQDAYLNFVTESNDATAVANGRSQNQHLVDKAIRGAKANAAWEKEHPTLNTWGNVLSAVPFAVVAAPAGAWGLSGISALGDAVAATSTGQAITAGLAPLATAASTSVAEAPLYTWADAGLSSVFGGHGIQTAIDEGGISPMTALEVAPLGRLAKPIAKESALAVENYRYPLGRPQVPESFLTVKPQVRTKVGDVEINNPQLFYRQGSAEMGDDFIKSGVVRTSGGFENPMYTEGALFKKVPTRTKGGLSKGDKIALEGPYSKTKSDLLVTDSSVDMIPADQGSGKNYTWFEDYMSDPFAEESLFDKSRVPLFDDTATSANTTAYRWLPGYGYRKMSERVPSLTWGKARTIMQYNDTGSPYNNLGSFIWNSTPFEKPSINIKSSQIGSYIREGSEQAVYNAAKNADEVKKVQLRRGFSTIDDIRNFHRTSGFMNRNKVPFHERLSISGYLTNPETNSIYPVYSQGKLNPFIEPTTELISQEQLFEWENVIAPEIKEMMRKRGYVGDVNNGFKGPMYVGDIHPRNIGFNKNGQIRIFDLSIE